MPVADREEWLLIRSTGVLCPPHWIIPGRFFQVSGDAGFPVLIPFTDMELNRDETTDLKVATP
ncbi:hypothetical protein GCM10023116_08680 [Kistimonas scapharcae]|uniref:Uncharacterized protein n=1 Tax=Kistimonas scapharcae TaxID=1036133 RepID=A0ABP8UZK9_9GAMM